MFVDRIERHDVINAVMLAAVLLLLGFGLLTAARGLTGSDDLVETSKTTVTTVDPAASVTAPPVIESSTLPDARPAGEVTVRVGNGARRPGVAGAGTEKLAAAGYLTLPPKNGPTMDDSIVYYGTGFASEAAGVAVVLGLEPTRISPMPADPGLPVDGANVIAILGVNSDY